MGIRVRLLLSLLALLLCSLAAPWAARAAGAHGVASTPGGVTGDFDGDGYSDLAVGVPLEDLGSGNSVRDAGAVNVLYGSVSGLSSARNQQWTQNSGTIKNQINAGDNWGFGMTAGDFDGDGASDLAVGSPFDDLPGLADAGGVNILYGVAGTGLTDARNQYFTADDLGAAAAGENFGLSLTSGDFNGDGVSDLAVGIPGRSVGGVFDAGAVAVLYGVPGSGLSTSGSQTWSQGVDGILGTAQTGDAIGTYSLAGANFGNGPEDDLAIGSPFDNESGLRNDGSVNVIYGSGTGLTSTGNQLWRQDSPAVVGQSENDDYFGFDVAAADFGNGAEADLAVGAVGETLGGTAKPAAGGVNVLFGTAAGLSASANQFITQDTSGVQGVAASNDGFGNALAGADFGGTVEADLAIGVAGDLVNGHGGAGSVNVLFGSASGLVITGNQLWNQDSPGIAGAAESDDGFAFDVAAADFGKGPQADLASGAALEDLSGKSDAGLVNIIYGASAGLTSAGNQFWTQDTPGIVGISESQDLFGGSFGFASASLSPR
jgi:FG-GAP repeat protein